MISLDPKTIPMLRRGKHLLAFSAGVDSSALFFLLLEANIDFDIAIVNYGLREQSHSELLYAYSLAERYHLQCHSINAPSFETNFEKNARDFRYGFFDDLMQKYSYNTLITAHQLNDQLEWLLMRLTKGAGAVELLGIEPLSRRKFYQLVRPLLHLTKEELEDYLKSHNYQYFLDQSNHNEKYERNWFRAHISDLLISRYSKGIARSFEYLRADKRSLLQDQYQERYQYKDLFILEIKEVRHKTRVIDLYLKRLGYLLSGAQREELSRESSIVFGGEWAVEIVDKLIYIAPYIKRVMPKAYKEACRIAKIPPKIRGYAYLHKLEPNSMALES
jgi:tRNA(Ile)-lysidine synthase